MSRASISWACRDAFRTSSAVLYYVERLLLGCDVLGCPYRSQTTFQMMLDSVSR